MIRLVPSAGPAAGRPVELGDGARLGRLPDCELRIAHASVSRVHARVESRDDGWYLVDADSRNGLFAAGRRVREVRLVPGAAVRLGEFELTVADERGGSAAVIDEDLEFDLGDEPDVATAAADSGPGDSGPGDTGGIELEDPAEIALGSAASRPERSAPRAPAEASAAAGARERSAEYLAEQSRARGGLVRGELTQQPAWVQALAFAGVLALGAAIAWGVFAAVSA